MAIDDFKKISACLWRINPLKVEKMDQELEKSRDRNEERIRSAMERPENFDAVQSGILFQRK